MANEPLEMQQKPKQNRTQQRKIALLNISNRAGINVFLWLLCVCVWVCAFFSLARRDSHSHTLMHNRRFFDGIAFYVFFFFLLFADIFICLLFLFGNACSRISMYNAREMMTPKIFGHHTRCGWISVRARTQQQPTAKKKLNHYQFKCVRLPSSGYYTRQSNIIRVWSKHEKRKLHKLREAFELNRLNHYWRLHK